MTVETDDEASKRVFYTAHYHTMIAPTLFCDVNGEYRGMNDMIYTDPKKANYTTLSLWDTYRAYCPINPVMSLDAPSPILSVLVKKPSSFVVKGLSPPNKAISP